MKHIYKILALVVIYAAATIPTPYHLGPAGIFLFKIGYNLLSLVFWVAFIALMRKVWRPEPMTSEGRLSTAWKFLCATALAFLIFGLTLSVKQFAYGPYWSTPDRPMFAFGWPIPWKWETQGGPQFRIWVMVLDALCCFALSLFIFGFRRLKPFAIAFFAPLLLSLVIALATGSISSVCHFFFLNRYVKTSSSIAPAHRHVNPPGTARGRTAQSSPYFANITNEWFQGRHANVLALANQRLAANTNDVAGCLIRASYDFVYADASTQSNSLDRLLAVYGSVTSPAYQRACLFLEADVAGIKLWLSRETPAQHAETLEKGSRPGRLPHYFRQLKALDEDGYFDN